MQKAQRERWEQSGEERPGRRAEGESSRVNKVKNSKSKHQQKYTRRRQNLELYGGEVMENVFKSRVFKKTHAPFKSASPALKWSE